MEIVDTQQHSTELLDNLQIRTFDAFLRLIQLPVMSLRLIQLPVKGKRQAEMPLPGGQAKLLAATPKRQVGRSLYERRRERPLHPRRTRI